MEEKGKLVKTREWEGMERLVNTSFKTIKHLWSVEVGAAGLLFWLLALVSALSPQKLWTAGLALGFGAWFLVKAKKELKLKEGK